MCFDKVPHWAFSTCIKEEVAINRDAYSWSIVWNQRATPPAWY